MVVGLSPIDFENKTSDSALSIYSIVTGTVKREGKFCDNTAWSIILLHEILFIS